jgi:energy-coupling factor transporter ATP-binding protein EcfA2
MRKGMLIVFLGTVGVGKTTIIKSLAELFKEKDQRVHTGFLKAFHGTSYVLHVLIVKMLRLRSKGRYAPWFILEKTGRSSTSKALLIISLYLDAFFNIPLKLIYFELLRILGYDVFVEEYIYTTLFDYISRAKHTLKMKNYPKLPFKILLALLNKYKPDKVVVLTTCPKDLLARWKIRGYGDPQPRYVKLLDRYCLNLVSHPKKIIINTCGLDIRKTVALVYKLISS